ncbi:MAG: hypothetical protein FWH57_07260 [Oscillospiraceae bacterium]|nr:hypothetical protein [Oscillospiraceae bacterium]
MKSKNGIFLIFTVIFTTMVLFQSAAIADTDGSEILITEQPEKLILQLGPQ